MSEDVKDFTNDGIRDFSARKHVRFRIDDDVFDGVPNVPALVLVEYSVMLEKIDAAKTEEQPELYRTMFNLVLTEESAQRFNARMSDRLNPISLDQVANIVEWLMEQYGMRPTEPPSDSSTGPASPDGGTNSTASAQHVESISSDFLQPAS